MHLIFRSARAALALLALSLATLAAEAHSVRFNIVSPSNLNPTPANTTTRIRLEYYNNLGALLHTAYCGLSGCGPSFIGASKIVAALEFNSSREEFVSERCAGVLSTVPQGFCVNGALDVVMRLRYGKLAIRHVTDRGVPLLEQSASVGPLFHFTEDARRYWDVPSLRVGKFHVFPAGRYSVTSPDLPGHCLPVVTNNGVVVEVPADGEATVEIHYKGTECSVRVVADREVPGLTMQSTTGSLTCTGGRAGEQQTVCQGRVRFNEQTRLTASFPPGLQPYFEWVGNTCERLPLDRTTCTFTPTSDITYISLSAQAAGAPAPPADPVGLEIAAGASPPADGLVVKGSSAVAALHLRAMPLNGAASLQAIVLQATGSGRDDLDLPSVKLVADANGNGLADAGEVVLAQGRPALDNGSLRLALATPLMIAAGTDLVVVADVASDIHTASAAAWGGAGTLLALGLVAWPSSRRRFGAGIAAATIAIVLVSACGGGGDDDSVAPAVEAEALPVAPVVPPVLLTYRLDLVAVEAVDAAATATALTVNALPITGATLTVAQ